MSLVDSGDAVWKLIGRKEKIEKEKSHAREIERGPLIASMIWGRAIVFIRRQCRDKNKYATK